MSDYANRSPQAINQGMGMASQRASEDEYRAQQDVQYLVYAEEIKRDKDRLERARAYLRARMSDLTAVATDIGALDA